MEQSVLSPDQRQQAVTVARMTQFTYNGSLRWKREDAKLPFGLPAPPQSERFFTSDFPSEIYSAAFEDRKYILRVVLPSRSALLSLQELQHLGVSGWHYVSLHAYDLSNNHMEDVRSLSMLNSLADAVRSQFDPIQTGVSAAG